MASLHEIKAAPWEVGEEGQAHRLPDPAPPEALASAMLARMKEERDEARAEVARLEAVIDNIIRVVDGYTPTPPQGGWKP